MSNVDTHSYLDTTVTVPAGTTLLLTVKGEEESADLTDQLAFLAHVWTTGLITEPAPVNGETTVDFAELWLSADTGVQVNGTDVDVNDLLAGIAGIFQHFLTTAVRELRDNTAD